MNDSDFNGWVDPLTGKPLSSLSSCESPDLTKRIDAIAKGQKRHAQFSSPYALPINPAPIGLQQLEQKMLALMPKIMEYSPPRVVETPNYELARILKAGFDAKAYLEEKVYKGIKRLDKQRGNEDNPNDKLAYVRAVRSILHVRRHFLLELQKFVHANTPAYDASLPRIMVCFKGIKTPWFTLAGIEELGQHYYREDQELVNKIKEQYGRKP